MRADTTRITKRFLGAAAAFFAAAAFPVFAEISFENPDLNSQNDVLFTVHHTMPGSESYRTAFMANASKTGSSKILTCFPEKMELLSGGAVLQIRNRYGTARYSSADGSLAWVTRTKQIPCESVRQGPESVSPDGKWLCFVKKNDAATGPLVLKNVSTLTETILNQHAEFSYDGVSAKWAGDSSAVVYEKDGSVYFCDPKAEFQQVQMTEQFRRIGWGSINSVNWSGDKTLIYIDHDLIYRMNSNELFTRGLYAPLVGTGTVCGRLPVTFDPHKDRFWVSKDASSMLVVQANSIVSYFKVPKSGFAYVQSVYSSPIRDVRGTVLDYEVFWSDDCEPVLWINMLGLEHGERRCSVYRISSDLKILMSMGQTLEPVVSPDGRRVAFGAGKSFYVYDVSSWKLVSRLGGEEPVSYAWNGNSYVYAGGASSVRLWKIPDEAPLTGGAAPAADKLLFLSAVKTLFWNGGNGAVYAQNAENDSLFYSYDSSKNSWLPVAGSVDVPSYSVQNGRYRVFTGTTPNVLFDNTLYVRTLSGKPVTLPLFAETAEKTQPHKKVALVFDAVDNADGLSRILSVLREYGVQGTFFINGEFVRRYPNEAKLIIASGYECGSLFFTSADLTEKGFIVDEEFIRRGLARNEDEFFTATGSELSLIWHAPLYHATKLIKKAGNDAGYRYADAGGFCFDTVTLEDSASGKSKYMSAGDIIETVTSYLSDGSLVPVSVGISRGTRSDYLYEKLDLLISALLDSGCDIVSARSLLN